MTGCYRCGYAVGSQPIDLIVKGRLEELWVCPKHLNELLDAVEAQRGVVLRGVASRPVNGRDGSRNPTPSIKKGL